MKKTLKPIAMVMALTLLVGALLTGCGGQGGGTDDAIVGKWTATEVEVAGTKMNLQDAAEMANMEISLTMDFKADGTVAVEGNVMGQTQSGSGTWKNENGTYTITSEGQSMEMTLKDGQLSTTMSGTTLILTK